MESMAFMVGYVVGLSISLVLLAVTAWVFASILCRRTFMGRSMAGQAMALIAGAILAIALSVAYMHIPIGVYGLVMMYRQVIRTTEIQYGNRR